ncbi:uncharacterized protein LOC134207014 [Armigeres subalbatus]|uniref:uncharacterized protein LOC134207014 n=1 Tax=Armigeres subalbatus TaxID=124917 RepID=UPI002ED54BD2
MENIQEDDILTFHFISVIKKHPVLYVKSSKAYRNVFIKDNVWLNVANEVKLPTDEVKSKWKHLRDRFMKELRRVEETTASGAGTATVYEPTWRFYEELSFLAEHCKRRSTTSNYKPSVTQQQDALTSPQGDGQDSFIVEEQEYEDLEILEDVENENSTPMSSTSVSEPNKRKRKELALDNKMHKIMDIVGDVASSIQSEQTNRHKDFCCYLGRRMSMLPKKVARDLEVEFTARVNGLIDIYCDE